MDLLSEFQIELVTPPVDLVWPPTLCRDIAVEGDVVPMEEILSRYDMTVEDYDNLSSLPAYKLELANWRRKVLEEGDSFKLKMQSLCSIFVPELHKLGTENTIDPRVRLDAIKTAARLAHYEPKDGPGGPASNVPQVNIQINM